MIAVSYVARGRGGQERLPSVVSMWLWSAPIFAGVIAANVVGDIRSMLLAASGGELLTTLLVRNPRSR
jgi:hypothetical protein